MIATMIVVHKLDNDYYYSINGGPWLPATQDEIKGLLKLT